MALNIASRASLVDMNTKRCKTPAFTFNKYFLNSLLLISSDYFCALLVTVSDYVTLYYSHLSGLMYRTC